MPIFADSVKSVVFSLLENLPCPVSRLVFARLEKGGFTLAKLIRLHAWGFAAGCPLQPPDARCFQTGSWRQKQLQPQEKLMKVAGGCYEAVLKRPRPLQKVLTLTKSRV